LLAVDVSNYTTPLTPDALAQWQQAGVGLVIVQAIDPPPGFPTGETRAQLQACKDAGLPVDAYVWLWFDLDGSDIAHKLSMLDGFNVRRIWLDVEDTAAQKYNQADTEAKVQAALDLCDAYPHTDPHPTGIYTGAWFWTSVRYMDNTHTFSSRDLWDANYDGQATDDNFKSYGGWPARTMHQYQGTSTLDGIANVDLDFLLDLTRETPIDWPWLTWREAAINYKAIADALGQQLAAQGSATA